MMTPYQRLLATFRSRRFTAPSSIEAAITTLPEVGTLPSPEVTWTLIVLARYRRLQCWAKHITWHHVIAKLTLADLQPDHPTRTRGQVRGLAGWSFDLDLQSHHGLLRHRATGRLVSFSAMPDDVESPMHVPELLRHIGRCEPDGPEARFLALHEGYPAVRQSVRALVAARLLERVGGDVVVVRFSAQGLDHVDDVVEFGDEWAGSEPHNRIWLAASIGDWAHAIAAAGASGKTGLATVIARHTEQSRMAGAAEAAKSAEGPTTRSDRSRLVTTQKQPYA
jgi:hypothetical protein